MVVCGGCTLKERTLPGQTVASSFTTTPSHSSECDTWHTKSHPPFNLGIGARMHIKLAFANKQHIKVRK